MPVSNLPPSQQFDFYSNGLSAGESNIFGAFLGPLAEMPKHDAYAGRNLAKINMPDAYFDKTGNMYVQKTIEDLFLTAQWDFWTERIMPWFKTDKLSFQWTKWHANPHYMGVTPHQAVSKVVTQGRTIARASIIRRGIAAEFELDFVTTPEGRTSFMASLAQMARSVQETANVEILRALLHCHRTQQDRHREYGLVHKYDFDTWLETKANHFMISQKIYKGMELYNTFVDKEQEQYGGTANVWILPREIHDHCDLAYDEKLLYKNAGPEGIRRLNGDNNTSQAAGGTMGNLRSLEPKRLVAGIPVFLAKSFHVDGIGHPELMSQITEIGVYNMMVDRTRDYTRYTTESRMLRVYNNGNDRWADLELAAAIYGCGVFEDTGEGRLRDVFSRRNTSQGRLNELYDDENDFLSRQLPDGTRVNIEYVGDMAPSHLTTENLEAAGQTLLNQLAYGDGARIQQLLASADVIRAGGARGDAAAADAGFIELVDRLADLVGRDNLFLIGNQVEVRTKVVELLRAGYAPVVREGGPAAQANAPIGASVDGVSEADAQTFLIKGLGQIIPASHTEQLQQIATNTTVEWKKRALAIKKLAAECKKADATSVPSMPDAASIDTFHKQEVTQFAAKMAQRAAAAPIASSSSSGAAAADAPEVRYLRAGERMPEGFRFVHANPFSRDAQIFGHSAFRQSSAVASASMASAAGARARLGARVTPGARGDNDAERARDASYEKESTIAPAAAVIGRYNNLGHQMEAIRNGSSHILLKVLAQVYAGTVFTRSRFLAFARANVYVPLGFLLMRPHATFKTLFGIKCADNGGSGYMMYGHGNMMLERTAAQKTGLMHYTTYLSAVVFEPRNVYVAENLFCQRYLGGMDVSFWAPADYKNAGPNRKSKSIICAPLPPNFKTIEQKIDIRGRWFTDMHMNMITKERFNKPLYPGAGRINELYGLRESSRADVQATRVRTPANTVCWQGMEWYRNPITGAWDDFTVESGNMGSSVYPGCGAIRNGLTRNLEDPGYDKIRK